MLDINLAALTSGDKSMIAAVHRAVVDECLGEYPRYLRRRINGMMTPPIDVSRLDKRGREGWRY